MELQRKSSFIGTIQQFTLAPDLFQFDLGIQKKEKFRKVFIC